MQETVHTVFAARSVKETVNMPPYEPVPRGFGIRERGAKLDSRKHCREGEARSDSAPIAAVELGEGGAN